MTYDQITAKHYTAIADWDKMEDNDRWHPKIMEIDFEYYKDYHPFSFGTSFIIENIRNEFIQNQRYHMIERLVEQVSYHYKYLLKDNPHKKITIKGFFSNDVKKELELDNFFYFFNHADKMITSKILVYKDQANFYNFFIQKKQQSNKIELIEFIEKRKNGNHHLKCSDINERILENMILIDEIEFRSCVYHGDDFAPSFGSCDLILNKRIVGRDMFFRKPRYDCLADFIKHEIQFNSKLINPILGIQFNKKGSTINNDLHYTFEYMQMYHEKELIKVVNKVDVKTPEKVENIDDSKNKRKNFTLETKLLTIKKQECRDSDFDFVLKDEVLPLDYDHITDRTNNSKENCQALSVISHSIKTRKPSVYEKIINNKKEYIVDLLNCLTSSKIFLKLYLEGVIKIKSPSDADFVNGMFFL
jgi:hypothetical protein